MSQYKKTHHIKLLPIIQMSIRSVPLIQILGTELLGSWLARLRIKKLIEESLSAGASALVQPPVGGVVYSTPFLDLR